MTDDNSKDMSVVYDDRNMPLSFVRTGVDSDYLVENRYDASGNRVSKVVFTRSVTNGSAGAWTFANATHYTGVGNEIRENAGAVDAKVVVNMPQGLGRYAAGSNNSFEWYLKNHLGSTMLVYNTGSVSAVKAAYDYRAFGKRLSLVQSSDRVTEEFTGKELDEETELSYFGARFLDVDLGMWVGIDPKRQFASPYLYAGNNPVIMIDPDGKDAIIVRDGNNLTVYVPVFFGGADGKTAETFASYIEKQWSGQFGKYTVQTIVTPGMKNTAYIASREKQEGERSHVINWEHAYLFAEDRQNTVAHEGGHLLGIDDSYYTDSGRPFLGYENNIMGNTQPGGSRDVFESDIDEMLNAKGNTVIDVGEDGE